MEVRLDHFLDFLKIAIVLCLFFTVSNSFGQISKGNWLVGVSGSFYHTQYGPSSNEYTETNVTLSPVIGRFFKNNFVAGLKPSFSYSYYKSSGGSQFMRKYEVGPFLRYYFLPNPNKLNVFAQGDFQYGILNVRDNTNFHTKSFSLSAGPVIFLTNSIGLEFTTGYSFSKIKEYQNETERLEVGIGLQIHLKK